MGNKPTDVFNRRKIFEMPWKIHFETGPVDVVDIWAILYLTSYLMGEGRGPKIVFDHFQYS